MPFAACRNTPSWRTSKLGKLSPAAEKITCDPATKTSDPHFWAWNVVTLVPVQGAATSAATPGALWPPPARASPASPAAAPLLSGHILIFLRVYIRIDTGVTTDLHWLGFGLGCRHRSRAIPSRRILHHRWTVCHLVGFQSCSEGCGEVIQKSWNRKSEVAFLARPVQKAKSETLCEGFWTSCLWKCFLINKAYIWHSYWIGKPASVRKYELNKELVLWSKHACRAC